MALTIQEVLNNGHQPSLNEVRGLASRLGLPAAGTKNEIIAELGEYERQTENLRRECAVKGLATDGDRADLELRLSQAHAEAVNVNDRKAYRISIIVAICMGFAGLAISLPHVSAEISRLMGCGLFFGWLMGLVIDGGFITMKVIDCLSDKFRFNKQQTYIFRGIMSVCLVVSALLNASQFLRNVADGTVLEKCLAVMFAVFISVFVFAMFYIGASMLVRCEDKGKTKDAEIDDADRLIAAANELKRLKLAASKV